MNELKGIPYEVATPQQTAERLVELAREAEKAQREALITALGGFILQCEKARVGLLNDELPILRLEKASGRFISFDFLGEIQLEMDDEGKIRSCKVLLNQMEGKDTGSLVARQQTWIQHNSGPERTGDRKWTTYS